MNRILTIAVSLSVVVGFGASQACGALLFSDNFNVADTTNFDGASLTGRRSGSLASTVFLRSALTQQHIDGNRLEMIKAGGNTGRVRFQDAGGWHDWAGGAEGATILADGGLRVEFDWTNINTGTGDWISFNIGHSGPGAGEPGFRVNHAQTDYGILLRGNGGVQRFDNAAGSALTGFTPTLTPQHVKIDFTFNSFADGSAVNAVATVGGTQVDDYNFTWNNNGGELYMELGSLLTGMLIDNYSISTLGPAAPPAFTVQPANDWVAEIPAGTYTHAVNFGGDGVSTTTINGVPFVATGAGAFPDGNITYPQSWTGTDSNNVTDCLLDDQFIHSNQSSANLNLTDLTDGQQYLLKLFFVGWGGGPRPTTIEDLDTGEQFNFDPQANGENNGTILSYLYTAQSDGELNLRLSFGGNNSPHMYALTNQEVTSVIPEPITMLALGLGLTGLGGYMKKRKRL